MNATDSMMGPRMHSLSFMAVTLRFRANLAQTRVWRRKPTVAASGGSSGSARPNSNTFHGETMKKGLWNLIGKVPVLVLAVAVGPVAMADGPSAPSGPIQLIAMESNSYDAATPPPAPAPVPAAPAAPAAADAC